MSSFGIVNDIIQCIKSLYNSSKSSVLLNNNIGTMFNTTVGVRQRCLLSLVLLNIFMEKIMVDSVTNQPSSISIGGRTFYYLQFADDIDLIAGSESERQTITDALEKISSAYGMEINHDKCKILVNGEGPTPIIYMYDKDIENVEHFKYLGAMITNFGHSKI